MKTLKIFSFILILLSLACSTQAQQTVTVHFLYGSTPARGYEKLEKKRFGGKKGGHVSIETGDSIIGFQPKGTCHIVGKKQYCNGYFRADDKRKWMTDTVGNKYSSILIPLTNEQYCKVKITVVNYLQKTPYDYAFLGMRCAAATYDVLEQAGIVKKRSRLAKWTAFFYPQLLRRQMLKMAKENNYAVVKHAGRSTRSWEME
ncbi:MAG: hypothetical protein ABIY51_12185 [Ferruginibacter sp.]